MSRSLSASAVKLELGRSGGTELFIVVLLDCLVALTPRVQFCFSCFDFSFQTPQNLAISPISDSLRNKLPRILGSQISQFTSTFFEFVLSEVELLL